METPPRDPKESIVGRKQWVLMAVLGTSITVATLSAFVLSLFWLALDTESSVTVAFLTLALGQLWNVFNLRDPEAGLLRNEVSRNPYIWGAIALCLGLVALALWLPPLSDVMQLVSPGGAGLALAATASLLPLILGQTWIAWEHKAVSPSKTEAV